MQSPGLRDAIAASETSSSPGRSRIPHARQSARSSSPSLWRSSRISTAAHTAAVGSTRSAGASRGLGVVLAILAGLAAVPACGITGLAAADYYHQTSWPIAFTIAYFAVGAAWLALLVTTISGRLRLIAASFLTLLVLVVGLLTFYLARLT